MRIYLAALFFVIFSLAGFSVAGTSGSASLPDFVELAKNLKPAVVNISTAKTIQPRRPKMPVPRGPYEDFFEEFSY